MQLDFPVLDRLLGDSQGMYSMPSEWRALGNEATFAARRKTSLR